MTNSQVYQDAFNATLANLKKAKCKVGKPCGDVCIPKNAKCRDKNKLRLPALGGQFDRTTTNQNASAPKKNLGPKIGRGTQLTLAAFAGAGLTAFAIGTGVHVKRNIVEGGTDFVKLTPQQNQYYDSSFPSDDDFKKAKFKELQLASSGSNQKGTHALYEATVPDGRKFFVKKAYELSVAKEVAAYDIAKEVGLGDSILPARKIYREGKPHVVNPLLKQEDLKKLGGEKDLKDYVKSLHKDKVADIVLFDYIIHNQDRHSGNFLVRKDNSVQLIDQGAVKWDLPSKISTRLDPERNFFYKHGMKGDPNTEIPEETLRKYVGSRDEIRQIMAYRYSGQPRNIADPIMEKLEKRFDVLESMIDSGDRRAKYLISGQPVTKIKQTEVFSKDSQKNRVINGIPLKSGDPDYYKKIVDNVSFSEPPFPSHLKGANRKSGVVVLEPDGRMWLYEPKNHYAGTINSFAKGGVEKHLTPQQSAVKEGYEELGLQVKIVDWLGDFDHSTGKLLKPEDKPKAMIRHYVAIRTGGAPWEAHWEADKVKLATSDDAKKLLNKRRDQNILRTISRYATSPEGIRKIQESYKEETKRRQVNWQPSMTSTDAENWSAKSAYKKTVYHATSRPAAEAIKQTGFNLGFRKVGRAYGNGVYLGTSGSDVEVYRKLYGDEGVTLNLKTDLRKILDVDAEVRKLKRKGIFSQGATIKPKKAVGEISANLGQGNDYNNMVKLIRAENRKLKKELQEKKVTQEEFNRRYADHPETEAFSYIAQRSGYDAIKLKWGRAGIGMLVVFNPKNVTIFE